ncbi:MAG: OsmC family peroxiredoxin [Actinomycetota bacterium]|nr:OsmC family peroxiredoxin [Actinomycetota bacterium]
MATTRTAQTIWEGSLTEGSGRVELQSSGLGTFDVSWPARTEHANTDQAKAKTSPEELIAAAHSACFSMALSGGLAKAGTPPTKLDTSAEVEFTPGTGITGIKLTVVGTVEGMTEEQFVEAAQGAKENCPVSKALTGTTITLDASLA